MAVKLDDIVCVPNSEGVYNMGKIVRIHEDGERFTVEVDGLRSVYSMLDFLKKKEGM